MPPIHIDTLPVEILAEIFCAYAHGVVAVWQANTILCLVSRRWREVAVSCAQLWSTIPIELSSDGMSPPIEIVQFWLSRSKNAPLEIDLTQWALDEAQVVVDYANLVFDALISHIHRWRRLVIDMNGNARAIPFCKAELLEYIRVFDDGHEEGPGVIPVDEDYIRDIPNTPNLRSLRWMSDRDVREEYLTRFPLERLTAVEFECPMPLAGMLSIMQRCTSATELGMHIELYSDSDEEEDGTHSHAPIVTLPSVRIFSHTIYRDSYDTFHHFDFPNLQVLDLDIPLFYSRQPADISPLSDYVSNSRHSIQVLGIRNYSLQLDKLPAFFSNVSKIPVVGVETSRPPDDIQTLINEAVSLNPQADFKTVTVPDLEDIPDSVDMVLMGWADATVYEEVIASADDEGDPLEAIVKLRRLF